jgi:hypothetical protein
MISFKTHYSLYVIMNLVIKTNLIMTMVRTLMFMKNNWFYYFFDFNLMILINFFMITNYLSNLFIMISFNIKTLMILIYFNSIL